MVDKNTGSDRLTYRSMQILTSGQGEIRMRILDIKNNHAIIEVEKTELDNIINDYLDLQYKVGYEEGYNDWQQLNKENKE